MTDKELMQQALDALEKHVLEYETAEALRARLAQPEPEPVFWATNALAHEWVVTKEKVANDSIPLYTAPPQREWFGLTDDDLHALHCELKCAAMGATSTLGMYRILERALREKNNG